VYEIVSQTEPHQDMDVLDAAIAISCVISYLLFEILCYTENMREREREEERLILVFFVSHKQ
jgi:hypothetical protein